MKAEDKQALISKVKGLDGLTNDEKAQLISFIKTKTYGLVWENSTEKSWEQLKEYIPVLVEDKGKAIINDTEDKKNPNHILIEGDNLLALTNLCYTHAGKVDVIYIDPPYNTGKEDFKYNDKFIKPDDDFRHSMWLSFMNKRLLMAKQLLSDNGLLFVSIGDDEEANLQMLCKQIFGEGNYIETYIWESTFRPDNSSPILRRNAEFVLCCAKNKANVSKFKNVPSETSGMASLTKGKEARQTLSFPAKYVKTTLPNGTYAAGLKENGNNLQWELMNDATVENGVFVTEVVLSGNSYWHTQKKILQEQKAGTEIWIKSESFVPYYKKNQDSGNRPTKILPQKLVNDGLYGNTEIKGIFGEVVFNNPKPSTLITRLVDFVDNKDALILDFFAGSGTTLQAVMNLNESDMGHRQCIIVTNNENNICEEITYERNKRVIQGYTNNNGESVEGLHNNLRYYRVDMDKVPRKRTQRNKYLLAYYSVPLLNITEDIYHEEDSFFGITCNQYELRYFKDGDKQMLVVLNEDKLDDVIPVIENMQGAEKIKIYLFTNGNYCYNDDFESVADKIDVVAIPYSLYNTYDNILPDEEEEQLNIGDATIPEEDINLSFEDYNKED